MWLADSDGHNPRQLTRLSAHLIGFPHWSADSRLIIFHARVPKTPQIYQLRLEDDSLRTLTDGEPGFALPSFSRDGLSIFCDRVGAGSPLVQKFMLYKMDAEGGSRDALWHGSNPAQGPGRNTLVYLKPEQPGIYERSFFGDRALSEEIRLVPDLVPFQALCVTSEGIFYTSVSRSRWRGEIRFYSFATRQTTAIAPANAGSTVSLKPDGTSLAYDGDAGTDSQLVGVELRQE